MGGWSLTRWQTGKGLTHQFALLSLIVVGLITAALCLVISHYLRKDLLQREWGITADFILTEARQVLTPSDFAAPSTPTAQNRFRTLYDHATRMPEIVRVKIYDAGMAVVWSDEPRLVGQRFSDNAELRAALAGNTVVSLETGEKKGENIYEGPDLSELVEVYVPITFPGTSQVAGVVEAYKAPRRVFANIRRAQITVVSTALAGGALLYLSLFWIVRRAARRIEHQHAALEERGEELGAANKELRAVQTQLLDAERMAAIGEVVTAVAHGIRNPLANIRASAQVAALDCRQCPLVRPTPKSLSNIMTEVDRLESRVRELLQFVRPAERQNRPLDLNAVLREVLRTMAERLARAEVQVDERLASALPPILGDPLLAEQTFQNLIGNALEAMPAGGRLTLTTGVQRADGGAPQVFAEVQDSGPGIPPEELSKIFALFYTTKAQGTGVGLPLAKKFTEAHGGAIAVRSRPGEGATFRVVFPVPPEA